MQNPVAGFGSDLVAETSIARALPYLPPVSSDDLSKARAEKTFDPRAAALMEAEREYIAARREKHGLSQDGKAAGLALSGGGIRSAAFALGVLQKLAAEKYLRVFDYLSTVSGGDFIGSSLTWLTSKPFFENSGGVRFDVGTDSVPLPYGADDPRQAAPYHLPRIADQFLTYLRSHGQYLMPGGGISLVWGFAVVLRGIFINLFVWFPIVTILVALLISLSPNCVPHWVPNCGDNRFLCFPSSDEQLTLQPYSLPSGFVWALMLAVVPWAAFMLFSLIFSVFTVLPPLPGALRYRVRRSFERFGHWALLWAI